MTPANPEDQPPASFPQDWNTPKPETVAKPTWSPAALAFGITLTVWGLVASLIILGIGLLTLILSIALWIGDILHERKQP